MRRRLLTKSERVLYNKAKGTPRRLPAVFPTFSGSAGEGKKKAWKIAEKSAGRYIGNDLHRRKSRRENQFKTSNGKRGLKNAQNLSAEKTAEKEGTRLPEKNGYRQRKKSAEKKTPEGQRKTVLLRDVFRNGRKTPETRRSGFYACGAVAEPRRNSCEAAAKQLCCAAGSFAEGSGKGGQESVPSPKKMRGGN